MEYSSAIKKNEIRPLAATWMDLKSVILSESIILSEVSQTDKEKYNILYMWDLKRNGANELIKQKENHRKWTHGCSGEGIVRDFAKVMYTLLYLKWITNKSFCIAHRTLLNVMCQPGWDGAWERMDTCIRMTEFPSVFTWNYHNIVNWLYPNTKYLWS